MYFDTKSYLKSNHNHDTSSTDNFFFLSNFRAINSHSLYSTYLQVNEVIDLKYKIFIIDYQNLDQWGIFCFFFFF